MSAVATDVRFSVLKAAFQKQFAKLAQQQLYVLDVPYDVLWQTYLNAFDHNPIFKTRSEHDCSYCRHFIRDVGALVALDNGVVRSVWDFKVGNATHQKVADAMTALAERYPIRDVFLTWQNSAGKDKNRAEIDGVIHTFEHFYVSIPERFVVAKDSIATKLGKIRTDGELLNKALTQIKPEAVQQVLELIASNSIYRGEEFQASVQKLAALQKLWGNSSVRSEVFAWENIDAPVARIKNTAIGTLLEDLSADMDVEDAVKSFEAKVAPQNYKRPTSLVTPRMIEDAKKKAAELGLLDAMRRRYATLSDVSVNDVLFADRTARTKMKGDDAFADLVKETPINAKAFDRVDEIGIDAFLANVLPTVSSLEVFFENRQIGNLVSLVTEVTPGAKLFKWNNPFSWSYNGDMADSLIRRSVQERGGRVDGVFRFSHSWNYDRRNASLMDLHVFLPGSTVSRTDGCNDSYGNSMRVGWNQRRHLASGGVQDVDYTPAAPEGYVPVENTTFPSLERMPDGEYVCKIHNWSLRAPTHGGFKAEIEFDDQVFEYEMVRPLKNKEWVTVAVVTKKRDRFTIEHKLSSSASARTEWGITTGQFHRVNAVMLSPNHWNGESIGNKHFLFILADCVNSGNARGFYNEFLRSDLDPHRKVLELIGSRQRTEETPNQLSGLGFSSTKKQTLIVRVKGQVSRVMKITF